MIFLCPRMSLSYEDQTIKDHFRRGYQYKDILVLLKKNHGVTISIRTLHRRLERMGLSRMYLNVSSAALLQDIDSVLLTESYENRGYRNIRQRLMQQGKQYSMNNVRLALQVIDPQGVEMRRKHRLKRRKYFSLGPNEIWHIDGNDKLKPFGFCIHGAIDGFSRKMLWLKVSESNKDPEIIVSYYINALKKLSGAPRKIRADRGTENVHICSSQRFLRRHHIDACAGEKSFQYGRSVSNQRIESWWSYLKKDTLEVWVNYFKDLRDQGLYNDTDNLNVEALKFCFYGCLQTDLDDTFEYWNNHRIRHTIGANGPHDRPNIMYELPAKFNCTERKVSIDISDLNLVESSLCKTPSQFCCSKEFRDLAGILMAENNLDWPATRRECETLYFTLINLIQNI